MRRSLSPPGGWSSCMRSRQGGAAVRGWHSGEALPVLVAAERSRKGRRMGRGGAMEAGHRVPLGGTGWSVWRDVCVRSAGFPADMVLNICDEPVARSADLADGDGAGRLAYDRAYADAAERMS